MLTPPEESRYSLVEEKAETYEREERMPARVGHAAIAREGTGSHNDPDGQDGAYCNQRLERPAGSQTQQQNGK